MAEPEHNDAELDAFTQALRVVSRHGSTDRDREDQAAALAVLTEVLAEEAQARHDADNAADHWGRSARVLRTQLNPGPGAWRGFSG